MNVLNALRWRYAVKHFTDEKLTSSQVKDLLEATRLTASSYGLQPYNIISVESKPLRESLIPYSYGQNKVLNSSHLIVLAAHTQIGAHTVERYINKYIEASKSTHSDLINLSVHMKSVLSGMTAEQQQEWAHQQAYIALGNLLTSAALMGIDACPMTGFDKEGYDSVLGLKEKGLTSTVICPIGHRDPSDIQATATKVRFDYNEIVTEI
jgi:nitroreductase/dihydropteridine reductase